MPKRIVPVIQIDLAVRHAKMGNSNPWMWLLHHWYATVARSAFHVHAFKWMLSHLPLSHHAGQFYLARFSCKSKEGPRVWSWGAPYLWRIALTHPLLVVLKKRSKEVQCNGAKRGCKATLLHLTTPRGSNQLASKNLLMTETFGFSADDEIRFDQGLFLSIGINTWSNSRSVSVGRGSTPSIKGKCRIVQKSLCCLEE